MSGEHDDVDMRETQEADPILPVNFSIVQATNIVLVYVIDAYRPVAGEVTLAVMGFKCK